MTFPLAHGFVLPTPDDERTSDAPDPSGLPGCAADARADVRARFGRGKLELTYPFVFGLGLNCSSSPSAPQVPGVSRLRHAGDTPQVASERRLDLLHDADQGWCDTPMRNGWRRPENVDLSDVEVLAPSEITAPVRVRKVLYRGHKEQVAERWAQLGTAPEGTERYIEFDPQPMAYRRWRIVSVGPPLDPERVAETPDQAPGAAHLRRLARDAGAYD